MNGPSLSPLASGGGLRSLAPLDAHPARAPRRRSSLTRTARRTPRPSTRRSRTARSHRTTPRARATARRRPSRRRILLDIRWRDDASSKRCVRRPKNDDTRSPSDRTRGPRADRTSRRSNGRLRASRAEPADRPRSRDRTTIPRRTESHVHTLPPRGRGADRLRETRRRPARTRCPPRTADGLRGHSRATGRRPLRAPPVPRERSVRIGSAPPVGRSAAPRRPDRSHRRVRTPRRPGRRPSDRRRSSTEHDGTRGSARTRGSTRTPLPRRRRLVGTDLRSRGTRVSP